MQWWPDSPARERFLGALGSARLVYSNILSSGPLMNFGRRQVSANPLHIFPEKLLKKGRRSNSKTASQM